MQVKSRAFLLIAAVVLAGCVGQQGGTGGGGTAGVIIQSFSPEVPEVDSDTQVLFFTNVKNVGDVVASNVEIKLSGLDDWTGTQTASLGTLVPADPARGLEGEERIQEFNLKSPAKDVTITYFPTARVTYTYETKSTIQFSFATREQIRATPEESTAQVTTTGGPFLITVRGKLPVVSSDRREAVVQLEIQNVGGGRAGKGRTVADIDFIRFSIEKQSGGTFSCPTDPNIRLIGGKSRLVTCKITFSTIQPAQAVTATLDIKLNYDYFVDTESSVTLLKTLAPIAPGATPPAAIPPATGCAPGTYPYCSSNECRIALANGAECNPTCNNICSGSMECRGGHCCELAQWWDSCTNSCQPTLGQGQSCNSGCTDRCSGAMTCCPSGGLQNTCQFRC